VKTSLSISDQEELGDDFMDQCRDLLQRHLNLIELHTQGMIREKIIDVRRIRDELENHSGHNFRKLLKAREYRRLSRRTFKIIKRVSDRAVEDSLLAQIVGATQGPGVAPEGQGGPGGGGGGGPGNNLGTATTHSDPFSDSHARSTLTDIHIDDFDEMELSTFGNEDRSEGATVIDLIRRGAPTQHIVGTFTTDVFSGDRTGREALGAAALSIHRDDGTSPRLVQTPLPFLSPGDHRNQDAETHTISSVSPSETFDPSK